MAKIIEFIAPVEAMRGDLSGGNKPGYGEQGKQSGFAAPGRALFYDKKYIGAKRRFMGNVKKGFSLRTKTTFSARSQFPCAALGGAASLANAAMHTLAIAGTITEIYIRKREKGLTGDLSERGWLTKVIRESLIAKQPSVTISDTNAVGTISVTINNPWVEGGTGTDVTIPSDVLDKFDSYLSA